MGRSQPDPATAPPPADATQLIDNLILDPFHGGSHAYVTSLVSRFLPGVTRTETLGSHLFKWRMGVASLWFADIIQREALEPKLLITTDMLDLSRLKGLCGERLHRAKSVLIMHENQLSYPRRASEREDLHLGLTNLFSCWVADLIWWNSQHHYDLFMEHAERFIGLFPKRVPSDLLERIRERSVVLGLPLDLDELRSLRRPAGSPRPPGRLRIAWNHRMQHDKNPDRLFGWLHGLAQQGLDFELHLLGPRHQPAPEVLFALKERVIDHQFPERRPYLELLSRCDVVVADPAQEHFGLSVAEAVQLGLWPIVRHGLCYPEWIPEDLHPDCLFSNQRAFEALVYAAVNQPERRCETLYDRFAAPQVVAQLCERLSSG